MFFIAAITLGLILVGVAAFIYGTIRLSKFAFRVSTGRGVAVLLFPPYALYFAFAELEEEDKAIPTASWLFGVVVTTLLLVLFQTPISLLLSGQTDKLEAKSPGEVATDKYGSTDVSLTEPDTGTTGGSEETSEADAGDVGAGDGGGAASGDAGQDSAD